MTDTYTEIKDSSSVKEYVIHKTNAAPIKWGHENESANYMLTEMVHPIYKPCLIICKICTPYKLY